MSNYKTESGYMLESEEESARLSNQHEVIKDAMGGSLLRVPINLSNEKLRILDSGTADGTWIRELISTIPSSNTSHSFIGTDINTKEFPKTVPPNTEFHFQDVTMPWPRPWLSSFDLVHQRLTLPGAGKQQKLAVQQLASLVKAGGWIQLIEAENVPYEQDGACMHDFITFKRTVFTAMGANVLLTSAIPMWLKEVGLKKLDSELIWLKLGKANADAELGKRGVYSTSRLVEALVPFAQCLPEGAIVFKESGSRLETFAADLRNELGEKGGHLPLRVLWASKPL